MTDNQRGSLWMMASMAGFAIEDIGLKFLSRQMSPGAILGLEGLLGMVWFALMARAAGQAPLPLARLGRTMAVRSVFELAGRVFYALAVVFAPISLVSAILQATPLVVVPVAAVLFGERLGPLRLAVTAAGFLGVLIVLHPGAGSVDVTSLLALAGMLGFAGRDLATRAAPPALSNAQLGVAGFGVLALSGGLILAASGEVHAPEPLGWLLFAGLSAAGLFGYAALTRAMRTGEVGAVTPFRYSRLVFALVLAGVVFGDRPDLPMLAGALIIVACGLVLMLAGRR